MRHNREINIKKAELIEKIKANKEAHIKDYEEAVIAYRNKAAEAIAKAQQDLSDGSLKIVISLVTPVNRADEYDKVIEMFNWETKDEIVINQEEFNEYVHDENTSSIQAKFTNSTYR